MKCCHNQDKEKEKKLIHYEKLGEFQDDHNEENDKLISLAVMLNALENKEMKKQDKKKSENRFQKSYTIKTNKNDLWRR